MLNEVTNEMGAAATAGDRVMGFTVPGRSGRGRMMRLDDTLDVILSAHDYPPVLARALGEALVLTALIGSALKGDADQTTVQAKAEDGAVGLIVCDYRAGELRGYLGFDVEKAAALPEDPDLPALFGKGYLAVTLEPSGGEERYQGIVPLEGADIAEAFATYFASSEQIPTLLKVGVSQDDDGSWRAGGMLLQHLPRGEQDKVRLHAADTHEDWAHLAALGATVTAAELTDTALPMETLLWRLFNEDEVRTLPTTPLSRGCRCSASHIEARLGTLPEAHRAELREDDGQVRVDCEFCSRQFVVSV